LEINLSLARKEAEAANKKSQELAVKVIESGSYKKTTDELKKNEN
jgi:hypothetical protein